jgi:hypothetical protein
LDLNSVVLNVAFDQDKTQTDALVEVQKHRKLKSASKQGHIINRPLPTVVVIVVQQYRTGFKNSSSFA